MRKTTQTVHLFLYIYHKALQSPLAAAAAALNTIQTEAAELSQGSHAI